MTDEYLAHVRQEEMKYLLAYEEWEKSLSPEDRAALNGAGVPDLEDYQAHNTKRTVLGISEDIASSQMCAVTPDLAAAMDSPADVLREAFGLDEAAAEQLVHLIERRVKLEVERERARVLHRVVMNFLDCSNAKLLAAALSFAADVAGDCCLGTMQDWAIKNGVSRQAVSKVAKRWQDQLDLPPSRHMRDAVTCARYSVAQKQKHWRKNLPKFAGLLTGKLAKGAKGAAGAVADGKQ